MSGFAETDGELRDGSFASLRIQVIDLISGRLRADLAQHRVEGDINCKGCEKDRAEVAPCATVGPAVEAISPDNHKNAYDQCLDGFGVAHLLQTLEVKYRHAARYPDQLG